MPLSKTEQLKLLFHTRSSASQHFWNVFRVYGTLNSGLVAFGGLLALARGDPRSFPPALLIALGCVGLIVSFAWATSTARLIYHICNKEQLIRQLEETELPVDRRMLTAPTTKPPITVGFAFVLMSYPDRPSNRGGPCLHFISPARFTHLA